MVDVESNCTTALHAICATKRGRQWVAPVFCPPYEKCLARNEENNNYKSSPGGETCCNLHDAIISEVSLDKCRT